MARSLRSENQKTNPMSLNRWKIISAAKELAGIEDLKLSLRFVTGEVIRVV